jgi:hypothetical protein
MGILDPTGSSIADVIARLVQSPQVKYGTGQLKNTLPKVSGPLGSGLRGFGSGSSSNNKSTGVSSFNGLGASVASIAQMLGKSGQGGPGMQQQSDPLMDLYAKLIGDLQQPVKMPTGIDTKNLMEQVQNAINPIYDQRVQSAKKQTGEATADVKDMYRALSNDYERLAPEQLAQSKAAQEEIKQLYGTLRSNIKGDYARVSDEQGELFKQLGIEDALPAVLDQQDDQVLEASTAASENQAQQQQRYMDMGQADATYYREGSPIATMAGNEISTDMLSQLTDYLNQTEAERTSGIQTGYMDQLSQAQNQLAQQQQTAQSESSRRQEMLWQMLQGQLQGGQKQEALTPDSFIGQLPEPTQQAVGGAFQRLLRSPEAVYGKVEDKRNPVPGSFVETTPNWYLTQADEMLKRGEIDPTTYQALQMYMQLYFGMGK